MQSTLRDETRGTSESRRSRRLRGALMAGQIALCLSLLAGAGLLARSLWAMTSTPLGFNPNGLLTVDVQPPLKQMHTSEAMASYYARLEDQLRSVPGVSAIASASELPSGSMNSNGLVIEGAPPPPSDQVSFITYVSVSDDYFRALGIPLRSGSLLRNLLFGVRPFDLLTLGTTAMLLLACATLALLGPVRRATQVDATTVLR